MLGWLAAVAMAGPLTVSAAGRYTEHRYVPIDAIDAPVMARAPWSAGLSVEWAAAPRVGLAATGTAAVGSDVPLFSVALDGRGYVLGSAREGLFLGTQVAVADQWWVGGFSSRHRAELQLMPTVGARFAAGGVVLTGSVGAGVSSVRAMHGVAVAQLAVGWSPR